MTVYFAKAPSDINRGAIMRRLLIIAVSTLLTFPAAAYDTLINSSSSYTGKMFQEVDRAVSNKYKSETGARLRVHTINLSAVAEIKSAISGLSSDVISPESPFVIDQIAADTKQISIDWRSQFPNKSSPYSSAMVFVVRAGNPKNIHNWPDLSKEGVSLIFANPLFSYVGRYAFLGALANASQSHPDDDSAAKKDVIQLLKNRVLPRVGAAMSNVKFYVEGIGDAIITYESEALDSLQHHGSDKFEIIYPAMTVTTRFPVAVVDKVVDARKSRADAKLYLDFLYRKEGQSIIAKHYYRPYSPEMVDQQTMSMFPPINEFNIDQFLSQKNISPSSYFSEGGEYSKIEDEILREERKQLK